MLPSVCMAAIALTAAVLEGCIVSGHLHRSKRPVAKVLLHLVVI